MKRRAHPHVSTSANLRSSRDDTENASSSGSGDGNIPSMGSVVVSISGYSVLEKVKLMKLIDQTGALYTGSLGKGNTHLVCWEFHGAKYALAKKLRLTVVNHQWFEDCLRAGRRLPEGPYVMRSGREVGSLLWEPPVAVKASRHKKFPSFHDQAATLPNCSGPILISESPSRMHKNSDETRILAESLTYRNNQENVVTKNDRSSLKNKDKDAEKQMANTKLHAHPLHDDVDIVRTGKTYIDKAKSEVPRISTSKQNMDKRATKKRRLVKLSDCGNKADPARIGNSGDDKEGNSQLKNLEIEGKQGQGASSSNSGNEIIDCTPAKNIKNSNDSQPRESTSDMDAELGIDFELPLVPKPPVSGEDKEGNSQLKNLEIEGKQGQAASCSNTGNKIIDCTPAENIKNSNESQPRESKSDMDAELGIDFELPLVPKPPASNSASEISCAICWTDSSSSRGVLSCGHRFCFKCIHRWAVERVSKKKKEATCPLCLKSFDFITVTNPASSNDQKIFSQTIPELSDDNIFMVLGENGIAADLQLTTNLQCNICGSRDTEELLLKCYRCGKRAAHTFCLDPPLPPFPGLQWSCTLCTSGRRPYYELS